MKRLWLLAVLLPAQAQEWDKLPVSAIRIVNRVSSCLTLKPVSIAQAGGMVVTLTAGAVSRKSTGECGCRSAVLRYRVTDGPDKLERVSATFSTLSFKPGSERRLTLVLSGDGSIRYREPVTISVQCER